MVQYTEYFLRDELRNFFKGILSMPAASARLKTKALEALEIYLKEEEMKNVHGAEECKATKINQISITMLIHGRQAKFLASTW